MRVFVTGASGHIGSAVVPELIHAGHTVVGLARSDHSATAVAAMGAEICRGDLTDLDVLREAAGSADAVVHLGFEHGSTGGFADAVAHDMDVVTAIGDALEGTDKALLGIGLGRVENAAAHPNPRAAVARAIHNYADHGVRTVLIGVPNVTHSDRDRNGFLPRLIRIARDTGISAYVGEGTNTWSAGHTLDVAEVFALAVDKATAGSQFSAATEPAIPVRTIAEAIADHLGIQAVSLSPEQGADHFKTFPFININVNMPNDETRSRLGWQPTHPDLLTDLATGHYLTNH